MASWLRTMGFPVTFFSKIKAYWQLARHAEADRELERQLYILRSDLTRTANESEQLRSALREMEHTVEKLQLDKETCLEDIRHLERQLLLNSQGHQDPNAKKA